VLTPLKPARKALALDAHRINLERLPVGLRRFVGSFSEQLAYKLISVRGGTQIGVPKSLIFDHPLHHDLGSELYAELVAKRRGEILEVPKDDAIIRQHKHARVRELRAAGHSRDAVARQTGYSWRQVVNICNAGDEGCACVQSDLFAPASSHNATRSAAPRKVPTIKHALEAVHSVPMHDMFGIARRNAAQAKAKTAPQTRKD
jgi:hypothetical protein